LEQYSILICFLAIVAVIAWGAIDNRRNDREGHAQRKVEKAKRDAEELAEKRRVRAPKSSRP